MDKCSQGKRKNEKVLMNQCGLKSSTLKKKYGGWEMIKHEKN